MLGDDEPECHDRWARCGGGGVASTTPA
jgi:hypothetical protein